MCDFYTSQSKRDKKPASRQFKVTKPLTRSVIKSVKTPNEPTAMRTEAIDLTIYESTPEPNRPTPSFNGQLNLDEFAFQQPTNHFRKHRPIPKTEESNSAEVKAEPGSPCKWKGSTRSRALVVTPTPPPAEARGKREVKIEAEAQIVTTSRSDSNTQETKPPNSESNGPTSPLIRPNQPAQCHLPVIKLPGRKFNPVIKTPSKEVTYGVHTHEVTSIESAPEPRETRPSTAPKPSTTLSSRAATVSTQAVARVESLASASATTPIINVPPAAGPERQRSLRSMTASFVASACAEKNARTPSKSLSSSLPEPAPRRVARGMLALPPARASAASTQSTQSPFFGKNEENQPPSPAPKRKRAVVKASSCVSGPAAKKARKTRKPKERSTYKEPSVYAHLKPVPDLMGDNLIGIMCGTNPGIMTAEVGHNYAHPKNNFWESMYKSGITDHLLTCYEDETLPEKYQLGNTNLVDRPTKNELELSPAELVAGVPRLNEKVKKWKPEAVIIVGANNYKCFYKALYGRNHPGGTFVYGWKPEKIGAVPSWEADEKTAGGKPWNGARVYVCTSTSGLAASVPKWTKKQAWCELGKWINDRRRERGLPSYEANWVGYDEPDAEAVGQVAVEQAAVESEEELKDPDTY